MSQLLENLRENFKDEDARYAYVESYLNASIAAQIKKFRGDLSQQELADKIHTKQSGISRLENVSYSSWKVETLRKLARAFGLRLRISFEEFGTLVPEIENFNNGLKRRKFADDPIFNGAESEPSLDQAVSMIFTPEQSQQITRIVAEWFSNQTHGLQVDPSFLYGILYTKWLEAQGTSGITPPVRRKPMESAPLSLNPSGDVSLQVVEQMPA